MLTLETERLLLRPLTLDDVPELHALLDQEEAIWRYDHGDARSYDERIECVENRIA